MRLGGAAGERSVLGTTSGEFPHKWAVMFLIAVGFWNFLGAGVFGFLINLPIVSYYEIGTQFTANHGHGAMMGVYGMLAIGFFMFVARYFIPPDKASERGDEALVLEPEHRPGAGCCSSTSSRSASCSSTTAVQNGYWHARELDVLPAAARARFSSGCGCRATCCSSSAASARWSTWRCACSARDGATRGSRRRRDRGVHGVHGVTAGDPAIRPSGSTAYGLRLTAYGRGVTRVALPRRRPAGVSRRATVERERAGDFGNDRRRVRPETGGKCRPGGFTDPDIRPSGSRLTAHATGASRVSRCRRRRPAGVSRRATVERERAADFGNDRRRVRPETGGKCRPGGFTDPDIRPSGSRLTARTRGRHACRAATAPSGRCFPKGDCRTRKGG